MMRLILNLCKWRVRVIDLFWINIYEMHKKSDVNSFSFGFVFLYKVIIISTKGTQKLFHTQTTASPTEIFHQQKKIGNIYSHSPLELVYSV